MVDDMTSAIFTWQALIKCCKLCNNLFCTSYHMVEGSRIFASILVLQCWNYHTHVASLYQVIRGLEILNWKPRWIHYVYIVNIGYWEITLGTISDIVRPQLPLSWEVARKHWIIKLYRELVNTCCVYSLDIQWTIRCSFAQLLQYTKILPTH